MPLLQLKDGSKKFIDQIILKKASLEIQPGERIGLIGLNGSGKSTLLQILNGQEPLDEGELIIKKNSSIEYLPQDYFCKDEDLTLYEFLLNSFKNLTQMEEDIRSLEIKMGKEEIQNDKKRYNKITSRYNKLTQTYRRRGGYEYESKIKKVLHGLGFNDSESKLKMGQLSGGQKNRALLGQLLLKEPDLLLLDEPTNHLDTSSQEWLEEFLQSYRGAIAAVSHDRYFLDRNIERIWELNNGHLESYSGNYTFYQKEKKRRLSEWKDRYEKQQNKIKNMKAYIRRYRAGNKSGQARSRKKQLENLDRIPPPPPSPPIPRIHFPPASPSGSEVLKVNHLSHSFSDNGSSLLSDISFTLFRGRKIALIGDNGSGKTTLFKILTGRIESQTGEIKMGTGVKAAYYSQEHDDLDADKTLWEEMRSLTESKERTHRILGRFKFEEEDYPKLISELSGGERSRLAIARLTVTRSNLLLMDEPTNHLDIFSREMLNEALNEYPGTILIISHDRYFIDQTADKIWELKNGSLNIYHGSYSYYLQKKEEEKEKLKKSGPKKSKKKSSPSQKKDEKKQSSSLKEERSRIEEKIIEYEEKLSPLEEEISQPNFYERPEEEIASKNRRYKKLKEKLKTLYQKWEETVTK